MKDEGVASGQQQQHSSNSSQRQPQQAFLFFLHWGQSGWQWANGDGGGIGLSVRSP